MAKVTLKQPTRVLRDTNTRKRRHATEEAEAETEPVASGRASKRRRPEHEHDAFDFPPDDDEEPVEDVSSTAKPAKTRVRPPSARSAKANVVAQQVIPESSLANSTAQFKSSARMSKAGTQAEIRKLEAQIQDTRRKDTGMSETTLWRRRKDFERQLAMLKGSQTEDPEVLGTPRKMTRTQVEEEVASLGPQIKQSRDSGKNTKALYKQRKTLKTALENSAAGDVLVPTPQGRGRPPKRQLAKERAKSPEQTDQQVPTTKRTVKRTGRHLESVVMVVPPTRAQRQATRAQARAADEENEDENEEGAIPPSAQAPRNRSAVPESESEREDEEGDQDAEDDESSDGEDSENEDRKLVQRYKAAIQGAELPETGSKTRHMALLSGLKISFAEIADRVLRANDSKVSISNKCSRDLISDFHGIDTTRRKQGELDRAQLKEDMTAIAASVDKVQNVPVSTALLTDICAFIIPIGFRVFLDFFLSIEHKNMAEPEEDLLETSATLIDHLARFSKIVQKSTLNCSILEIRTTITKMITTLEVLADDIRHEAERLRRYHESVQSLERELKTRQLDKERRRQDARKQQIQSHLASIKSMVAIPHLAVQWILAGQESRPKEMIQALLHFEPEWFERLRMDAWERVQEATDVVDRLRYTNLSEYCEDVLQASLEKQGGQTRPTNGQSRTSNVKPAPPRASVPGIVAATNEWDWDSD